MKVLFVGDVYGSLGRDILKENLVKIQKQHEIDFTIVNAENTTNGRGLNAKHYKELSNLPIDVMTMGNHTFGQNEIFDYLPDATNIIRPLNGHPDWPGTGYTIKEWNGYKIATINILGATSITSAVNPFLAFDQLYEKIQKDCDIILVDFHAELTSEKIAFGYYVAARSQLCIGTHTHVQTADARILDQQCAYLTDVGMTGPLDGVIGVKKEIIIQRFLKDYPARFEMATGTKQLNAAIVTIDMDKKQATKIETIHIEEA